MSTKRMIGPFELGDRLGVGGMGIVYRAIYTKTGTPVAIKLLAPDLSDEFALQKRFEREIDILKKLKHPHIVRYYGGGKVGNQRFYAMELVTSGALEGYLEKKGKLPYEEALGFARQVCLALEHAHEAGVIHRDLKPANLLLTPEGTLKLTDFGIARDTTATALTAAGRTVGTYAYMAPEQIRGKPPVDRKTDLYALGCVLFEMIAGEPPFQAKNQGEILMMHLQEEAPRITSLVPECPMWVEDLIFNLLEKDPADRPYDALAVQVQIDDVITKITEQKSMAAHQATAGMSAIGATAAGGMKNPLAKKKKKKKRENIPVYEQWWFLTGALVLLVGFVVYVLQPRSKEQLLARARELMSSDDSVAWKDAYDGPLKQLRERFPEGDHVVDVEGYTDKYEMHRAEKVARANALRNRDPGSEAERLFMEADRFDKFGDRISALERYRSMLDLLQNRKDKKTDDRAYILLANREINRIEGSSENTVDRITLVNDNLAKAERLYGEGKKLEAQGLWRGIIRLYADNQELEIQVREARARLKEGSSDQ